MTPNAAQEGAERAEASVVLPGNDEQQTQYTDFLDYLNDRFCGFTGS